MRIDHEDTWLEHFHGYLRLQYLPHSAQRFPHFVHDWKVRLTEQLPHSLHDVHIDWILVTFCSLSFQVNKALFILHIFQTSSYAHSCYPFVATISWLQIQLRAGFDWQVCGEIFMAMSNYCDGFFDFSNPLPCCTRPSTIVWFGFLFFTSWVWKMFEILREMEDSAWGEEEYCEDTIPITQSNG